MTQPADTLPPSRHTVLSLLGAAADHLRSCGFDEARLHTELMLARVLQCSRLDLYLRFDRPVSPEETLAFKALFRRRLTHEPLQYILGDTEFYGMRFEVGPGVLIPRPETELLVERAVALASGLPRDPPAILDACTGSGNIAIALARHLPHARVTAMDASSAALGIAERNVHAHVPGRVELVQADLFTDFLPGQSFDMIASNPPYIPVSEFRDLQPEVREFEPRSATTDEGDGLRFHRRLGTIAMERLAQGGVLIVETGFGQAETVAGIFCDAGLDAPEISPDVAGIPRVVAARRP
jgi:release factor glutamine methyltransferase